MPDELPVHFEGYALTYAGSAHTGSVISRAELINAVARRSTVPLRVGDRIVGTAQLHADDTGLRVSATIEPQGERIVGVDEGVPIVERVHNTMAPEALRRGEARLAAALKTLTDSFGIDEVSIVADSGEKL